MSAAAQKPFPASVLPLFSDFDGDNKIDQAELFSNGAQKSIHVSLGKYVWKYLSFDSGVEDRGRLVSDDVDSDGDEDLVWISQDSPGTFVTWLGDGRGGFSKATGDETQQVLIFGKGDQHTRIIDDADDDETAYELQLTNMPLLDSGVSIRPIETIERSHIQRDSTHHSKPFLSAVLKRGPPSLLS
jgi:hypothetical protein